MSEAGTLTGTYTGNLVTHGAGDFIASNSCANNICAKIDAGTKRIIFGNSLGSSFFTYRTIVVSCNVLFTSVSTQSAITGKYDGIWYLWAFYLASNGSLRLYIQGTGGIGVQIITAANIVQANRWYRAAAVIGHKETAGTFGIYIDGVKVPTTISLDTIGSGDFDQGGYIGIGQIGNYNTGYLFDALSGKINEYWLYYSEENKYEFSPNLFEKYNTWLLEDFKKPNKLGLSFSKEIKHYFAIDTEDKLNFSTVNPKIGTLTAACIGMTSADFVTT